MRRGARSACWAAVVVGLMAGAGGCSSSIPPYEPNPPTSGAPKTPWRAVILDTNKLTRPDTSQTLQAILVPFWVTDVAEKHYAGGYESTVGTVSFDDMLFQELRASGFFEEVDHPEPAELVDSFRSYDLLITGTYLHDRRTYASTMGYGIPIVGPTITGILGMVGVPRGYATQTIAFEITAALPSRPHHVLWRKVIVADGAGQLVFLPMYEPLCPPAKFDRAVPETTGEGLLELRSALAEALRSGGVLDRAIRAERERRQRAGKAHREASTADKSAGCTADGQCKGSRICVGGTCRPGCTADQACKGNRVCNQGRCVAGCRTDSECKGRRVCRSGRCVAGCRSNGDCPGGRVCTQGRCGVGCSVDTQCKGNRICHQGQCVAPGGGR